MKTIIFISVVLTATIFSCSIEKHAATKPNKHAQLFTDTADSLNKYSDVSSIQEIIDIDSTIKDYTTLDYKSFKMKYSLSEKEMDELAETLKITYQIARTLKSIEENIQRIDIEKIDRLENTDTTKYSFNKIMPIDTSLILLNDSSLIKIMIETYDLDKDSLK